MFSPLNDPQVDRWFQRFNAPLKRLPAEEREQLHLEVRQHLDALVAANEELGSYPAEAWQLALVQFGDPTRIGRKLYQEWQRNSVSRSGSAAICFGVVLHLMWASATLFIWQHCSLVWQHHNIVWWNSWLAPTSVLFINALIGYRHPNQALKGALYSDILAMFGYLLCLMPEMLHPHLEYYGGHGMSTSVPAFMALLYMPLFALKACGIAYLASVTRRGWYTPTLADFKLSLPKRQVQAIR